MPSTVKKPRSAVNGRRERLAINLCDVTDEARLSEFMRTTLLGGKLAETWINVDPRQIDEAAVEFTCDLLTAACICDTIRTHDRLVKDSPTRVYLRRADAWRRLPGNVLLSIVSDGELKLNPIVFPDTSSVPAASKPLAVEAID